MHQCVALHLPHVFSSMRFTLTPSMNICGVNANSAVTLIAHLNIGRIVVLCNTTFNTISPLKRISIISHKLFEYNANEKTVLHLKVLRVSEGSHMGRVGKNHDFLQKIKKSDFLDFWIFLIFCSKCNIKSLSSVTSLI